MCTFQFLFRVTLAILLPLGTSVLVAQLCWAQTGSVRRHILLPALWRAPRIRSDSGGSAVPGGARRSGRVGCRCPSDSC